MDIIAPQVENNVIAPRRSPLKIAKDSASFSFPCFKSPRSPPSREAEARTVKCVMVGDANCGKTSLLQSFLFDEFSNEYFPTTRDDYTYCTTTKVPSDDGGMDVDVDLDISDTGGQTYLDRLRPLCYGSGVAYSTDVVIICFSVVVPSSFLNVTRRWLPELKRHCLNKSMKTILVGTQSDLRSNVNILIQLMEDGLTPISDSRAMRLSKKIGAKYIECSSFNGFNVKRVFETAIDSSISAAIIPSSSIMKPIPMPAPLSAQGLHDPKLFWKRWRLRQKSNKIKRLMLSCVH